MSTPSQKVDTLPSHGDNTTIEIPAPASYVSRKSSEADMKAEHRRLISLDAAVRHLNSTCKAYYEYNRESSTKDLLTLRDETQAASTAINSYIETYGYPSRADEEIKPVQRTNTLKDSLEQDFGAESTIVQQLISSGNQLGAIDDELTEAATDYDRKAFLITKSAGSLLEMLGYLEEIQNNLQSEKEE